MKGKFSGGPAGLLLVWLLFFGTGGAAQGQGASGYPRASRASGESGSSQEKDPLSYADPFIGTGRSDVFTRWGNEGGTYPGAVAPWGYMQLTPETRASGGYDHADSSIYFFSCFHHMSGYPGGSAGQIKVMPVGGEAVRSGAGAAGRSDVGSAGGVDAAGNLVGRHFLHSDEKASPGSYSVLFSDDHSLAEMTASERVGLFRFTFPAHIVPRIFVGGMGKVTRTSPRSLQGTAFAAALRYDRNDNGEEQVKDGLVLRFAASAEGATVIVLRISASTVSPESARKNMDGGDGSLGFDAMKERTAGKWRKELSVIRIADKDKAKKRIFYTALYHSLLVPWVISDVEGKYRGGDGSVHKTSGENEYGGFSPWDTFRSLHPLLCLIFPGRQRDMLLSMLDTYRQTGSLPAESMTGNHAVAIIVDSWLKGIHGSDSALAFEAMKKSLAGPSFRQPDRKIYHQLGYIPFSYPESVTRTVEYAYDDWALSRFAGMVMHREEESAPLLQASYNYRNLFDPGELFLLPRNGDQVRLQPGTSGYKEGDKWVYSFFVPQHVRDLINLMGGDEAFQARLDSALAGRSIVFDNETAFHIPYLFNYCGRPDRTQYWVRTIMDSRYSATPGGLPGNDDLGSMSSWYVLSALGIYPVCPGRPLYDIGSPIFGSATIRLAGGKTFVIRSMNASPQNIYVRSFSVNKKKIDRSWIPHEWIQRGGEMVFEMGGDTDGRGAVGGADGGIERETNQVMNGAADGAANEAADGAADEAADGAADGGADGKTNISMLGFSVQKKQVAPHELFWVRFTLRNEGSMGTKLVKLLVNGKEYGHKNCLLASGAVLTDSISCRLYMPGKSALKIGGMEGVQEVGVEAGGTDRAPLEITGLDGRPLLKKGEGQRISFTAQNIGCVTRLFNIPVRVNDSVVCTDSMVLGPGEKRTVSQDLTIGGEGLQTVRVMGERENFKIYGNDRESLLLDLSLDGIVGDSLAPDKSGFDNNGKVVRDSVTGRQSPDTGGPLLLGKNCYVEIPNSPSLDIMGETITMMAWVYPIEGGAGLVDLFTKGDNHVLQVVDNKKLSFFAGGWGRGDCTVDLPAGWLGHWHHIAGVCEGSTLRLYIDGGEKGTARVEGRVNLSVPNKWTLGRNEEFPGERIFNGRMGGVKIFEAPLTGEAIRAIEEKEKLFTFP